MRTTSSAPRRNRGFVADYAGTTPQTCVDIGLRVLACRMPLARVWDYDNLAAPYWRLYWNERGGATVSAGGARFPLTPDRLLLIPPEMPFATSLSRAVRHFHLHFLTRVRLRRQVARPFVIPAAGPPRALVRLLDGTLRAGRDRGIEFTTRASALAHLALACIPPETFADTFVDPRVARIAAFLREDLAHAPSNEDVGRVAALSVGAAIRIFKEEAGMTPMEFLSRVRVEAACVLLEHSRDTIDAIASATGYRDRYYFSRVFKKLRGVGPATYRQSMAHS